MGLTAVRSFMRTLNFRHIGAVHQSMAVAVRRFHTRGCWTMQAPLKLLRINYWRGACGDPVPKAVRQTQ